MGNKTRGSEKLLAAWKARVLTDESVQEIAASLNESRGKVERAQFTGARGATGLQLELSYAGDDIPFCGNDIMAWLRWRLKFGGSGRPPRILINGQPFPELLQLQLDYGNTLDGLPGVGGEVGKEGVGGVILVDGAMNRA